LSTARDETLPARVKAGFALGDHAINIQLAATSLFYLFFLTEIAGLPPSLAGLVLLVGRGVDAFTDPAMGRISDRTRWRWGRRRPYFLIGALPFGVTFAALWWQMPFRGDVALFAAYASVYVANTLCSTVLAVPYMALLPELALGYQERTSANTFRSIGVVLAILLTAVSVRPLVDLFGGGAGGWAGMGTLLGVWVALPWLVVHRVSWERPGFQRESQTGFVEGMRLMLRHRAYRRLGGLFLAARIALDVVGAMLIFYFTYWLARPDDFPFALALMLLMVVVSLPVWLRISRRVDKRSIFIAGAAWWICIQLGILFLMPSDARWIVFALTALAGIGYGVADMVPWSMLGDVIDADELATGERREGVYSGFFTFLRKLGGATGVAVAGFVLEIAGFAAGQPQPESALLAIRALTALVPAVFLTVAIVVARGYALSRARHGEILDRLAERS
jgi:sugar (glycoside-pentoside-hexuronide) transporter